MDSTKFFETKMRDSGERYIVCTEGRPDWVFEAIVDCHRVLDSYPCDWIYSKVEALFDAYGDDCEQEPHEAADDLVDIYACDLYRWATPARWGFIDDAAQELYGNQASEGIGDRIRAGQCMALCSMAKIVFEAIEDNFEFDES